MEIVNLNYNSSETLLKQATELLYSEFSEYWPAAWPNTTSAGKEVKQALGEDKICRAILDKKGDLVAWAGAVPSHGKTGWELHPLVVQKSKQRQGIGTKLVADIERQVMQRGGTLLWLGSDDENGMTSIANLDLFPDPLEHLKNIRDIKGHPFMFYKKQGFVICGVLPDANGLGKPDIFLAKRLR